MGVEPKDKQTTPDLGEMMVKGLEVFDLEPGQNFRSGADVEPTAAQPAPGVEIKEKKEELEKGEHPEEEAFRFTDHAAAEKGYKEQQGYVTKLEKEKKDLDQKMSQLEGRVSEFETKDKVEKEQKDREAVDQEILGFSRGKHEEVLAAIDALDPEGPETSKKVASLWADLNADIRKFERKALEKLTSGKEAETGKQTKGPEFGKEEQAAAASAAEPKEAAKVGTEDVQYVREKVLKIGRDPLSPVFQRAAIFTPDTGVAGSELSLDEQIDWALQKEKEIESLINAEGIVATDPVWLHFIQRAPVRSNEGAEVPLDDQVKWAVTKTKEHKAAERSKIKQELNLPLAASAASMAAKEGKPATRISFGSAIEKAVESRRL